MSEEKTIVHQITEAKEGQVTNYYLDGELFLNVDHTARIVQTSNQHSRRFENDSDLTEWIGAFTKCVLRKRKAYRPEFDNALIVDECFMESKKRSN